MVTALHGITTAITSQTSQRLGHVSQGHEQVVGDLVFLPATCHELASVGDDSALLFWDTRAGTSPALKVAGAHGDQGIQCVDWSLQDPNYVATGTFLGNEAAYFPGPLPAYDKPPQLAHRSSSRRQFRQFASCRSLRSSLWHFAYSGPRTCPKQFQKPMHTLFSGGEVALKSALSVL